MKLTQKEKEFLTYWQAKEHQRPPTWATMRKLMNLKSNQSIKEYIQSLKRKGEF